MAEDQLFSLIQHRKNMDEWWYIWRRINCSPLSTRERTWWNGGTNEGGSIVLTYLTEDEHGRMKVHMKGGSAIFTYSPEDEHTRSGMVVHKEEDHYFSLINQRKYIAEWRYIWC